MRYQSTILRVYNLAANYSLTSDLDKLRWNITSATKLDYIALLSVCARSNTTLLTSY